MALRTTLIGLAAVFCVCGCGEATSGARAPDAGGSCSPGDATAGFYPCDVEAILKVKCQRCHNEPSVTSVCSADNTCFPAPFSLVDWAITRESIGAGLIYERMGAMIRSGAMPYQSASVMPPVEPLTDAEKKTLLGWIEGCAPSGSGACQ